MDICVLHGGEVVHAQRVGIDPLHLGRAPSNDLVLPQVDVSGHHAMLYTEAGQVWLRDLGSSNGTFVNDVRVHEAVVLAPGDRVRLGARTLLKLSEGGAVSRAPLRLERADGALGWTVNDAAFAVPGAEGDVTLLVYDDEIWLAVDGMETQALTVGEPFEVGGAVYVVREVTGRTPDTVRATLAAHPFTLRVALAADRAELVHPNGRSCAITSPHRVAMLYALGRQLLDDPDGGWIDDADLAVAVWGRQSQTQTTNNLHVLVHRVRKEVDDAGLDRWFLEKRSGRTRVRVAQVVLED